MIDRSLPGADLIEEGLQDAALERRTVPALLVAIGAPRLQGLGISVPPFDCSGISPEMELYLLLSESYGVDAHAHYNSLIGKLVSFERALELEAGRRLRSYGKQ